MLLNLLFFSLLAAQTLSTSRYFVGLFYKSYPWAYPMDLCVSPDLGLTYMKYTCSADYSTVTATNYTDSACTKSSVSKTYTSSSGINGLYSFNCDGTDDYIKTKLYVSSCTSPIETGTVYAAINTCFEVSTYGNASSLLAYYEEAQCNSSTALISTYISGAASCDTSDLLAKLATVSSLSTTCSYYLEAPGLKIPIYAQMVDCRYDNYTQLPVTKTNNATYAGTSEKVAARYYFGIGISPSLTATSDPDLCGYDWYSYFTSTFGGCAVTVESRCNSDEGVGYPEVVLNVSVVMYKNAISSGQVSQYNCDTYTSDISTWIASYFNSVSIDSFSCYTESESAAYMNSINFIALAVFFIATASMYIF